MKYSILFIVLILFFSACSENEQINAPASSDNIRKANWISLPKPARNMTFQKKFHGTKKILKDKDTDLKIEEKYDGGVHGEVKIKTKIKFKKNSVHQNTVITMMINDEDGTLTFTPHMEFNEDAILDVKIEGLDLEGLTEEDFDFAYLDASGEVQILNYKEIKFDEDKGKLELKKGEVPHFSRYGFVRRNGGD